VSQWNANGPSDIGERGGGGEAGLHAALAGSEADAAGDVILYR
jgi:hypothetical protein